jgi:activator of HSP90 ATPase
MLKTIEQSVYFPASPKELFQIYIDPKKHAAMTGAPVTLQARTGGKFAAFGGMLSGTMVAIVPNRLIVQQWRSMMFKKNDLDSTLVLSFIPVGKGCRIDLVHVNVPKHDFLGVTRGWPKYYWKPLRAYLKKLKA